MRKIIPMIFISLFIIGAFASAQNESIGCSNLYWIDNDNKECGKKQFCGAYMYYGLQTFESKERCHEVAGISESCPVGSDKDNSKCSMNLSNGRKAEIKIMPETASEKAIERLGELNFTIQLKEVGKGNETKPIYELTGKKQGKFLGIFKIMERIKAQVDAENGSIKVIKPWWSFLVADVEKENLIGGCAGVSSENAQECCDNWAEENGIVKVACAGEWKIKNNKCSWQCSTE